MYRSVQGLVIRCSADINSFWESYDLFKSACGAGKVLGVLLALPPRPARGFPVPVFG
jgi:hypothetical protein